MLNKEELDAYCREYYNDIYRYCLHCLSNKEDAEDATQDTFAVFSKKAHLLDEKHIRTWLFRTAHHMILREYTRRYKKTNKEEPLKEEVLEASRRFTTFDENMISFYGGRFIREIYERLSDSEKELLEMCLDGNMKTAKMSEFLGIEQHACSMRKKRLKERCREIIEEILFY